MKTQGYQTPAIPVKPPSRPGGPGHLVFLHEPDLGTARDRHRTGTRGERYFQLSVLSEFLGDIELLEDDIVSRDVESGADNGVISLQSLGQFDAFECGALFIDVRPD